MLPALDQPRRQDEGAVAEGARERSGARLSTVSGQIRVVSKSRVASSQTMRYGRPGNEEGPFHPAGALSSADGLLLARALTRVLAALLIAGVTVMLLLLALSLV